MDEGYTRTADLRMYWQRHGSAGAATPVLLIHGGGMTIEQNWNLLLPRLSARGEVIAVEEEGHGRTRPIERPLTSQASALDIVAVLDDLGVDRVDILAFSAGCQTALALAIARPDRIRRVALVSAPWRRDAMIDGFWDGLAAGTPDDMPEEFRTEYLRLNPGDDAGFRRFFELDSQRMLTFRDWDDTAIIGIGAPALVVAGDRDVVTVDSALRLSRTLADARLLVVPGGHGEWLSDDVAGVDRIAPFVIEFLDG